MEKKQSLIKYVYYNILLAALEVTSLNTMTRFVQAEVYIQYFYIKQHPYRRMRRINNNVSSTSTIFVVAFFNVDSIIICNRNV